MSARAKVETTLRGWLADGTLVPDQRLPSESELIDQLEAPPVLRSKPYYVCRPRRADPAVTSWKRRASALIVEDSRFDVERVELASKAGRQADMHVLRCSVMVATAELGDPDHLDRI